MKLDGVRKTLHQLDKIRYRPPILYKIARGYFRTLVLGRPTLRIVEFSITAACQSRCGYCYAAKFRRPGERVLELDEIRDTWEQAKRMGAFSSLVLGGEPSLHPRFLDVIRILEPRKHIVSFSTNGISLTEEMVIELKQLGVHLIYVSLDSVDPVANDAARGYAGHFEHAMRAIELCKRYGIDPVIPITTSKLVLPETVRTLEFARQHGFTAHLSLISPTGRAAGWKDELFDTDFWKTLRALYDRNPGLRSDWDTNLTLRIGCPAGFEKVHVGPYGHVTGCAPQPFSFGNVRELPLEQIVGRMRGFRHYEKRSPSCLIALDREFIEDYLDFAADLPTTPYDVTLHPRYASDQRRH